MTDAMTSTDFEYEVPQHLIDYYAENSSLCFSAHVHLCDCLDHPHGDVQVDAGLGFASRAVSI